MTAKRAAAKPEPPPSVRLVPRGDGTLVAERPLRRLRFLLSDGSTIDVVTDRDDSDLRGAVLAHTGVVRIEGVAVIESP